MCRTPNCRAQGWGLRAQSWPGQAGFTLAALIVVMTLLMIVITYTVPQQWSAVMARERDAQTIFIMKQYARSIRAFQVKNGSPPTSLAQLKEARLPRLMRGSGEWIDPLTGKVDWIPVPAAAVQPQQNQIGPDGRPRPVTPPPPTSGSQPQPLGGSQPNPGQPGGFVGPIAGVKPAKTGKSVLTLNNSDSYENWQYTTQDLETEIQGRRQALMVK